MVGLVALLVLGPEKLPKAARLAGLWIGKARTMLATAKAEIKQELQAEEMRQLMHEQSLANELQKVMEETKSAIEDVKFNANTLIESNQEDDKPNTFK